MFISPTLAGWIAWWILVATMIVRPLTDVTGINILKRLIPYRKHLGIAIYLIAWLHIILIFLAYAFNLSIFWTPRFWDFNRKIAWGMVAILTLTPLFLTSNKISIRLLKRNWKRLHRIVYAAFIFVGIHIYLVEREVLLTLVPIGIWAVLWIWAYVKQKAMRKRTIAARNIQPPVSHPPPES